MEALGMFEVQGYLQAVVGADTAVKAANVKLENITKVKGGLVTVILTGDVGAINAAIDAVEHEIPALLLKSSHVIARPSKDTGSLYQNGGGNNNEDPSDDEVEVSKAEPVKKATSFKENVIRKVEEVKKEENKVEKVTDEKKPEDSTKK